MFLLISTIWLCIEIILITTILYYSVTDILINSQIQPQFIPNLFNFLAVSHGFHFIQTFHQGLALNLGFKILRLVISLGCLILLSINYWWFTGGSFLPNWGLYSYWAMWNGKIPYWDGMDKICSQGAGYTYGILVFKVILWVLDWIWELFTSIYTFGEIFSGKRWDNPHIKKGIETPEKTKSVWNLGLEWIAIWILFILTIGTNLTSNFLLVYAKVPPLLTLVDSSCYLLILTLTLTIILRKTFFIPTLLASVLGILGIWIEMLILGNSWLVDQDYFNYLAPPKTQTEEIFHCYYNLTGGGDPGGGSGEEFGEVKAHLFVILNRLIQITTIGLTVGGTISLGFELIEQLAYLQARLGSIPDLSEQRSLQHFPAFYGLARKKKMKKLVPQQVEPQPLSV